LAGDLATAPQKPLDITADWLTAVLRAQGALAAHSRVLDFDSQTIGEGVGLLGSLARITPRYDGPGAADRPRSLIGKFSTENMENRAVAMAFDVYGREIEFYKSVAPELPGLAPRCYAADYDRVSGAGVLLLEDLGDYRMGDQVEGCTADEAARLIELVAPVHAKYWGQTKTPSLGWAPAIDGEMQVQGYSYGCAAGWDPCAECFGHVIAPEILLLKDAFVAGMPGLSRMMATPVQTLIHGDLRLDNVMFAHNAAHRPAVAIDWIVCCSAGVHDAAYLLGQNLKLEERRAHERELIEHYADLLAGHGVENYSGEQAWQDYLSALLYTFTYGIVIGGTLDRSNARAFKMMEQLLARASCAVMDHDLLGRLPG
jgi:hypothetical protein